MMARAVRGPVIARVVITLAATGGLACNGVSGLVGEPADATVDEGVAPEQPAGPVAGTGPTLASRLESGAVPTFEPSATLRNPFRFGSVPQEVPTQAPAADGWPITDDLPAIIPVSPLAGVRLLGIVHRAVEPVSEGDRVAVLSDGDDVFHGKVGDVVGGRYEILHVMEDGVEIMALEQAQRQWLRLADM